MIDLVFCGLCNIDQIHSARGNDIRAGGNIIHIVRTLKQIAADHSRIGIISQVGRDFPFMDEFSGFDIRGITRSSLSTHVHFLADETGYRFADKEEVEVPHLFYPPEYLSAHITFCGALPIHVSQSLLRATTHGLRYLNFSPWNDTGDLFHLLPECDYFQLNRHEIKTLLDTDEPATAYRNLQAYSKNLRLIITQDQAGAALYRPDGFFSCKAPKVRCEFKYGAGAAFAASFIHSLSSGRTELQSLQRASVIASLYVDARRPTAAIDDRLIEREISALTENSA